MSVHIHIPAPLEHVIEEVEALVSRLRDLGHEATVRETPAAAPVAESQPADETPAVEPTEGAAPAGGEEARA